MMLVGYALRTPPYRLAWRGAQKHPTLRLDAS
jgi:hypothetical protein